MRISQTNGVFFILVVSTSIKKSSIQNIFTKGSLFSNKNNNMNALVNEEYSI